MAASGFAGAVMLTDLDDFIGPSQACTNPLFVGDGTTEKTTPEPEGSVMIHTGKPDLIKAAPAAAGGAARVSLDDCLACSGCVTSAEAVLVQQQSVGEFQAAVRSGEFSRVVVAVSLQSLASAAEHWTEAGSDPEPLGLVYRKIASFLKSQGATDVVDTGPGGDVALREAAAEFVSRLRAASPAADGAAKGRKRPRWETPLPTVALSDRRMLVTPAAGSDGAADEGATTAGPEGLAPIHAATAAAAAAGEVPTVEVRCDPADGHGAPLPVLSAECPGWVCYAEKTCPQALPYMSTAKSAQQVTGAVVKRLLAGKLRPEEGAVAAAASGADAGDPVSRPRTGLPSSDVLVCAIMPCFDKKLEASRKDFLDDVTKTKDVDLVLSTGELVEWMEASGHGAGTGLEPADLAGDAAADPLAVLRSLGDDGETIVCEAPELSGSGGYAAAVARAAAASLWGLSPETAASLDLDFEVGRNPDISTATLRRPGAAGEAPAGASDGSAPVLSELVIVRAYGFRNVQGVVNRLRRGRSSAHFVEVMACPGGCPNGGGQARPPPSSSTLAEDLIREKEAVQARARHVETALSARTRVPVGGLSAVVYRDVAPGGPGSAAAVELLHTRYHAVPKMPGTSGIKW